MTNQTVTDIKVGQVWEWDYRAGDSFLVISLKDDAVQYAYGNDPGSFHYSAPRDRVLTRARLVKDVDPKAHDDVRNETFDLGDSLSASLLDPADVKAGDTVTVHVVTIDSPAYDVSGEAYMLGHALAVGGHVLTGPGVTLTAHQPAPGPEAEWKPGTVAVVSYPKYMGDGDTLDAWAVLGSNGWHPFEDPTDIIAPQHVTDVRPLVVIDAADVDADKVFEAVLPLVEHDLGSGSAYRVRVTIRKVLAHLGLGTGV